MFDLGYLGNGTGVVCTDADGDARRDLVGVNAVDNGDGAATVSRTVVEIEGSTARHGATDEITVELGPDGVVPREYRGVRCGEHSISQEMIPT